MELSDMPQANDVFCIYPFKALNISPNGLVKPCCVYGDYFMPDGKYLSINEKQVREIWNSDGLRQIRQKMISGQKISGCSYCYTQEAQGFHSMRTDGIKAFDEGWLNPNKISIVELVEQTNDSECFIENGPSRFDLRMGNLCNLRCRMCSSESSSSIQSDKVQSKWPFPLDDFPQPAKWRNLKSRIAPQKVLGVSYKNLSKTEIYSHKEVSWIKDTVMINVDVSNLEFSGFSISLVNRSQTTLPFKIYVNNQVVREGSFIEEEWSCIFVEDELDLQSKDLMISVEAASKDGACKEQLGIAEVALLRKDQRSNSISLSRFDAGLPWYRNPDFIKNDLLYDLASIYHIGIIGGEPLLIKEILDFMKYLISQDVSGNITLSFSTNATIVSPEWYELAQRFAAITIAVSIDGVGELNDYIRYPSNWTDIERNLKYLQRLNNAYVYVNTSVSPYNLLDVVDIIDFCEKNNLDFLYHPIDEPQQLKVSHIPYSIREIAADRLRLYGLKNSEQDFRANARINNRAQAVKLAEALVFYDNTNEDISKEISEFMIYTNDLDLSRSQKFANVGSELIDCLNKLGYSWTTELRHLSI